MTDPHVPAAPDPDTGAVTGAETGVETGADSLGGPEAGPSTEVAGPPSGEPTSAGTEAVRRAAEERGYAVQVLGPRALRVQGRFGEPTLAALEVLLDAQAPLGVWAEGVEGGRSALCLWTGPDVYAITLGEGGRWEHFRAGQELFMLRDSWRGGDRGRYRVPHGALMRAIPEAVELALAWGFERPTTSMASPSSGAGATGSGRTSRSGAAGTGRPSRARATSTPARQLATEAPMKICPTCYTVLPSTGICDFCA